MQFGEDKFAYEEYQQIELVEHTTKMEVHSVINLFRTKFLSKRD